MFEIFFAVSIGIGMGLSILVPLKCGWEYFPQNRGFASGVITCGFGLGGLVFSLIATQLVNPSNESPSIVVVGGKVFDSNSPQAQATPYMLRITSLILIPIYLISVLLVRKKTE